MYLFGQIAKYTLHCSVINKRFLVVIKKTKQLNADNHICRSSRYLLTRRLCDKVTSYTRRRTCDKLDKLQWRLLLCINKGCMYVCMITC